MTKFPDPEDLISAAAQSAADSYPNPHREGCLPPGSLIRVIQRGTPLSQELRAHLLTCSPCFREYRAALEHVRVIHSRRRSWRPAGLMAVATAAAIIVLASVHFFRRAPRVEPGSQEPAIVARADRESLREVRVDLTTTPNLRQAPDRPAPIDVPVAVPAEEIRLVIRLPQDSPSGTYTVSILDAFGRTIKNVVATTSAEKTLTPLMDLRGIPLGTARLCAARSGEAPECRPVTIGGPSRSNRAGS